MRIPGWLPLLFVTTCFCACSNGPGGGGLRVELSTGSGSTALCARVVVSGGLQSQESEPLKLGTKLPLKVGVLQNTMPAEVTVQAIGYADAKCTTLSSPPEQSAKVDAKFARPVSVVMLTLARVNIDGGGGGAGGGGGGLTDADGDGSPLPLDCDDTDPAVKPGAAEVCTDGKDNDCNQKIDCADNACAGLGCGVSGVCTNKVCVAPTEANLCSDGVDNDLDGKIDCADSDCPTGALCSDQNACTLGDTCQGPDAGCLPAGNKLCASPPNALCFLPAGVCGGDGGACSYTQRSGACDDGLKCTTGETCVADGGACVGTAVTCAAPPSACFSAGVCSESLDGGCFYAALGATAACDDGNNCTLADRCDGDGGCTGTQTTCAVPGECFQPSGACNADGGCILSVKLNQPCDSGFCGADGGCQAPIFPYTPANFTEAQLPASLGALNINCGPAVLTTSAADGGVTWAGLCPTTTSPEVNIIVVGSQTAVLVYADSLFIDAGSSLRAIGARPLILAVRTGAVISGLLDVGSPAGSRGAGGSVGCAAGQGGDGGVGGNPESAGGGGGAAFGSDGTSGTNSEQNTAAGGAKGVAFGTPDLEPLRGGCRGGHGGHSNATWGFAGNGGGAVQVSVAGALLVTASGTVTAYGGGGKGGESDQRIGGGGAGSGGGILLEGNTVTVAALGAVTANGGGGGEGSGYGGAQYFGDDGSDGAPRSALPAPGGLSVACGGNGGNGATRTNGAGPAGPPGCNQSIPGGGGGGGVGRIRFNAATSCNLQGIISPQATGNRAGCM